MLYWYNIIEFILCHISLVYYIQIVLATCPGNPPVVQVRTRNTAWFASRTVWTPEPQHLGRQNPDPYPSTQRTWLGWLDTSVPISGSVCRVCVYMVTFRYPTANRKILTFAHHCPFRRIGNHYYWKQKKHVPGPILNMTVNGTSMIFGLALWVIKVVIGCKQS